MGLIARKFEEAGLCTVAIQQIREIAERLRIPRSVFLRFPYGQALGEPGNRNQHRAVIRECLRALRDAKTGGTIADPGFRWRREEYGEVRFD